MNAKTAGYSGTPLAKKLGIGEGARVFARNAPDNYQQLLAPVPAGVVFEKKLLPATGIVHLFTTRKGDLQKNLTTLRKSIRPDGVLWISWPKKAAAVPTDITEDAIRALALPLGWVDIKVCAIDAVWSGLKLVIRKELR